MSARMYFASSVAIVLFNMMMKTVFLFKNPLLKFAVGLQVFYVLMNMSLQIISIFFPHQISFEILETPTGGMVFLIPVIKANYELQSLFEE